MKLIFRPKAKTYTDLLANAQARRIWDEQQNNFVELLEQTSGLRFDQHSIHVISGVFSGTNSGWPGRQAMSIPLNYPMSNGTLYYRPDFELVNCIVHELAHRLFLKHGIFAPQPQGYEHAVEAHQHIYLLLPDVWRQAYSPDLVQKAIDDEINTDDTLGFIKPALTWAESLEPHQRGEMLAYLRKHKHLPSDQGAEAAIRSCKNTPQPVSRMY